MRIDYRWFSSFCNERLVMCYWWGRLGCCYGGSTADHIGGCCYMVTRGGNFGTDVQYIYDT